MLTGKTWSSLPPEEKQQYESLAKKLEYHHKAMFPDYTYTPKRKRHQVQRGVLTWQHTSG